MTLAELEAEMDRAVADLDFERAARLRDRIALVRGGAEDSETIDTSGIARQKPGAMGIGSSTQRVVPPEDWTPPKKPDPMTKGRSRRGRG